MLILDKVDILLGMQNYNVHHKFNLCSWFIGQLHQACEGAALRGSRVISAEDILFLMRKDKVRTLMSFKMIHSAFLPLFLCMSPTD